MIVSENVSKLFQIAVLLLGVLLSATSLAIEFPERPTDTDFFVDKAGIINAEAAEKINSLSSKLLKEEQIALFVVTIPSLSDYDAAGYSIEGYAADLFDEWGIGLKNRNYGMLLLVSKGDRKARIELGAAWERSHDRTAKEIMDNLIIPLFKKNDYSKGIVSGVEGLDAMARGLDLPSPEVPWWFMPVAILSIILIVSLIINLFKTGRKGWAWMLIALIATILFFILSALASSSDSGSSGGFGGGFSGGGGATGSW